MSHPNSTTPFPPPRQLPPAAFASHARSDERANVRTGQRAARTPLSSTRAAPTRHSYCKSPAKHQPRVWGEGISGTALHVKRGVQHLPPPLLPLHNRLRHQAPTQTPTPAPLHLPPNTARQPTRGCHRAPPTKPALCTSSSRADGFTATQRSTRWRQRAMNSLIRHSDRGGRERERNMRRLPTLAYSALHGQELFNTVHVCLNIQLRMTISEIKNKTKNITTHPRKRERDESTAPGSWEGGTGGWWGAGTSREEGGGEQEREDPRLVCWASSAASADTTHGEAVTHCDKTTAASHPPHETRATR